MREELKPVNCGCGGEAHYEVYENYNFGSYIAHIMICDKCGMRTAEWPSEAEAVEAWNRAMGATDTNVGDKVKDILERNEPLSWQELKQMEGKPVWVEIKEHLDEFDYRGKHYSFKREKESGYMFVRKVFDNILHLKRPNGTIFIAFKKDRISIWQSYRKERK